ncbi:hypothetical protein [Borrelia persica]|uniref:hypothetical protein n=1 Tax=Borrelia persica TaxID=44448 RepID=UPI000466FFF1|nr:hypothetical protein [Borrelia persica]
MKKIVMVFFYLSILVLFSVTFVSCASECSRFSDSKIEKVYNTLMYKVESYRAEFKRQFDNVVNFRVSFLPQNQTCGNDILKFSEDAARRSIMSTLGSNSELAGKVVEILSTLNLRMDKGDAKDIELAVRFLDQLQSVTRYGFVLLGKHLNKKNLRKVRDQLRFETGLVNLLDDIVFHLDQFIKARVALLSEIASFINNAVAKRGNKLEMINYLKSQIGSNTDILSSKILVGIVDNVLQIEKKLDDIFKL